MHISSNISRGEVVEHVLASLYHWVLSAFRLELVFGIRAMQSLCPATLIYDKAGSKLPIPVKCGEVTEEKVQGAKIWSAGGSNP
jgi:hypothetical protein